MSPYEIPIDADNRIVIQGDRILFEAKDKDGMGELRWYCRTQLLVENKVRYLLSEFHRLRSIADTVIPAKAGIHTAPLGALGALVVNACKKCGRSLALSQHPLLCDLCASVVNTSPFPPLPDPRPHGIHPDPQIWVQTFTGRKVYPFALNPESVCIDDIAHALSNICRFTGHTKTFYSVAQHSVLCSYHCPGAPLSALLHDAAEAYIGDIARPLKRSYAGIAEIEDNILRAIFRAFNIPYLDDWSNVAHIDEMMLATEARDLLRVVPNGITAEPLPMEIIPWTSNRAQQEFLRSFQELTAKVSK